MKLAGKIKFWNEKKGFGFISNGGKQDIFLEGWDLKDGSTPKSGDRVEFEVEPTEKGFRARNAGLVRKQVKREPVGQQRFTGPMDHNY